MMTVIVTIKVLSSPPFLTSCDEVVYYNRRLHLKSVSHVALDY